MYLVVYITLIIALTGLYAQVLSLQAARMFAHQTSMAQAMLIWHSTAVNQASKGVTTAAGAPGCDLTTIAVVGTPCIGTGGTAPVTVSTALGAGWTACSGSFTTNCWTTLPTGYKTTPYTFYSIMYQPTPNQNYVITFVPPPIPTAGNPAPGNITLPGTGLAALAQLGGTMSDLTRQLRNSGAAPTSYGTIITLGAVNYLNTLTISSGTTTSATSSYLQYTLPTGYTIPAGSIGIISSL